MTHEDAIAAILAREQEKGVVTEAELRQQLADVTNERDRAQNGCMELSSRVRELEHKMDYWKGTDEALKASEARNAEALELLEPLAAYAADSANAVMRARAVSARKLVAHQSAPATDGEGVSRVITLSGCKFTEHELIERAVRAATGTARRGTQRWIAMKDAFGCGSGVANALCHRFDFDPDEMVKP